MAVQKGDPIQEEEDDSAGVSAKLDPKLTKAICSLPKIGFCFHYVFINKVSNDMNAQREGLK